MALGKIPRMNDGPFLESSHTSKQGHPKNSFLTKQCGDYSLSAMAVVFGVGIVLVGLIVVFIGVAVDSLTVSSFYTVFLLCAVSWFIFVGWFWFSLVSIAKINKKHRVSDADLIALQALFFIIVFGNALFAPPQNKAVWHQLSLVFEWCVIAFHILYFLLALCVWVRLPLRSYIAFAIMLGLAIFQTVY